jgi:hypothetical protein
MEQSVAKRRHIKFRRRRPIQKKAYNVQNTAKVWNQESLYFRSHTECRSYLKWNLTDKKKPLSNAKHWNLTVRLTSCVPLLKTANALFRQRVDVSDSVLLAVSCGLSEWGTVIGWRKIIYGYSVLQNVQPCPPPHFLPVCSQLGVQGYSSRTLRLTAYLVASTEGTASLRLFLAMVCDYALDSFALVGTPRHSVCRVGTGYPVSRLGTRYPFSRLETGYPVSRLGTRYVSRLGTRYFFYPGGDQISCWPVGDQIFLLSRWGQIFFIWVGTRYPFIRVGTRYPVSRLGTRYFFYPGEDQIFC